MENVKSSLGVRFLFELFFSSFITLSFKSGLFKCFFSTIIVCALDLISLVK